MRTRFRVPYLALPLSALFFIGVTVAQQGGGAAVEQRPPVINASSSPLLQSFQFRSIGPASMGGRIDDIAVSESDPSVIYVGYAVGGLFKSENNGTTFKPVFETYTTASIGDIAIHPTDPNIVYVGTGEANNRQSSSFGDGIYKTTDGGKTFTNIGLKETQTTARIVIDPRSPDTVYVAALGHLFGSNPDRGVYKTTDGGKTWTKVKYIDPDTGFTDIAMDPSNSNILYAASYQRRRSGCCFDGGGPGSAIWKTQDAGRTWTKLTGAGLPPGTYGRIALDVSRSNPNVIYAQVQAGETGTTPPPANPPAAAGQTAGAAAGERGGGGEGRGARGGNAQPGGQAAPATTTSAAGGEQQRGGGGGGGNRGGQFDWCNNGGPTRGFPAPGRGGNGGGGRGNAAPEPANANATPQKPPMLDPKVGGVLRSEDKGATWKLMSNCNARPMYFSQIRVDPSNDKTIYVAGLPIAKSLDGGTTFATLDDAGGNGAPAHVDQHAIWIDPKNSKHVMIGNDGGLNVSWDQGKSWDFINTMATALAYVVSADMRHPYYVYVGLQDNGSWGGPSAVRAPGIMSSDWFRIGGGDGFYTAVDPNDYNIVYTESQDGNTNRYDLRTGRNTNIRPRTAPVPGEGARAGRGGGGGGAAENAATETPAENPQQEGGGGRGGGRGGPPNVLNADAPETYRYNWNTPVILSPHNSSVVWIGGNRLFKSYNRGDSWVASADLTKRIDRNDIQLMGVAGNLTQLSKNDGVTAYGTIITVSESPIVPGVVWAGTDDGNLQMSRDGGTTFSDVGKNLPGLPSTHRYWISRVEASHFDPATAYIAVDGHRSDDIKPYVYLTHDYGRTFQNISSNLPAFGNVQVIREDPKNKNLLYVGTEFGLYISLDAGKQWERFMNNYPTVRTDDILIHPRDGDLIVATHGRSVWIVDDITPLQQLTPEVMSQDAALFEIRPVVSYLNDQQRAQYSGGQKTFVGANAPRGTMISYYLKTASSGDVKITIADATGKVIRNIDGTKNAGINRVLWNLAPDPAPNAAGRGGGGGGGGGGGRGGANAAVEPGTYVVTLSAGGKTFTKPVTVLQDRWLGEH